MAFLIREFEILQPKVVLLLGQHSYTAFNTYLLQEPTGKISEEFSRLSPSTHLSIYQGAAIIPLLHPSPAAELSLSGLRSLALTCPAASNRRYRVGISSLTIPRTSGAQLQHN